MTGPGTSHRVEVKQGHQIVGAAEVTTSGQADGTVRTSLHAASGHVSPGSRARLVDAVMDLPEVQASERLEATVPLGDGESLERLRGADRRPRHAGRRVHRAAGCEHTLGQRITVPGVIVVVLPHRQDHPGAHRGLPLPPRQRGDAPAGAGPGACAGLAAGAPAG